jgi:integrase
LEEGAASANINREIAALKRMFNLGAKETPPKVDRVPYIQSLHEDNVKEGYFEDADYYALLEQLLDYMKGVVEFAYWIGWREAQIRNLTWDMVKIKDRLITAPGRITKNSKPHTIYMNDPVLDIIKQRRSQRNLGCPYVFHRSGKQIIDFRFVWNTACRIAGLGYGYRISSRYVKKHETEFKPGPTMHDFRRTMARNMTKAGIAEKATMAVGGWKTRSVFDRYNIITVDDLKHAAEKQAERVGERL